MKLIYKKAEKLRKELGAWGFHPKYTRSEWQYAVASNDTLLGYWEYVAKQILEEEEE